LSQLVHYPLDGYPALAGVVRHGINYNKNVILGDDRMLKNSRIRRANQLFLNTNSGSDLTIVGGSVAEPEPKGAGTFAGAIIMIQFSAPAPTRAFCCRLRILKSSDKSILLVSSVDYASTRTWPNTATGRSM
jgi:hypothetical protein